MTLLHQDLLDLDFVAAPLVAFEGGPASDTSIEFEELAQDGEFVAYSVSDSVYSSAHYTIAIDEETESVRVWEGDGGLAAWVKAELDAETIADL